jgi:hypothetical protein
MSISYRVRVHREWIGGGGLDPETYFGDVDETVTLIDRLLDHDSRYPSLTPIQMVQVDAFENGRLTGDRIAQIFPRS